MPEVRYFIVEQTRQVKILANSPIDAGRLAQAAFGGQVETTGVTGSILTPVREISLSVEEDR